MVFGKTRSKGFGPWKSFEGKLNRSRRNRLFSIIVEHLDAHGAVVEDSKGRAGPGGIPFMIPGTAVHVRINETILDNLARFTSIYLLLLSPGDNSLPKLTAAMVASVLGRVSILRAKYGEKCVVEALSESSPKTQEAINLVLYSRKCRYPKAKCRYMDKQYPDLCSIDQEAVGRILSYLEKKKVVEIDGPAATPTWGIVV